MNMRQNYWMSLFIIGWFNTDVLPAKKINNFMVSSLIAVFLKPFSWCTPSPAHFVCLPHLSHLIQLISADCKTWSVCVRYRETYKMCSAGGTSWRGLRTTALYDVSISIGTVACLSKRSAVSCCIHSSDIKSRDVSNQLYPMLLYTFSSLAFDDDTHKPGWRWGSWLWEKSKQFE